MQRICTKNVIENSIANTEAIYVYSFHLLLICAVYGLETFCATCHKIRSIYNQYRKLSGNMTFDKF
jgi:hypothetical protein